MTIYNHMFTLAFSVETPRSGREGDEVTADELKAGLLKRIQDLDENHEWLEATGAPDDTYVVPQIKYLLVPGLVRSQKDGETHHVTAPKLAMLYGVRMDECCELPWAHPDNAIARRILLDRVQRGELIALAPRDDGNYKLPEA